MSANLSRSTPSPMDFPSWMDDAACVESEANFFPRTGQNAAPAKAVCRGCSVSLACLRWAIETGSSDGVFGGMSPAERTKVRLGAASSQCRCGRLFATEKGLQIHQDRYCGRPPTHGTHIAYSHGCRCAECRAAHATYGRMMRARKKTAS